MEITTTFSVWFILMIFLGITINEGLSQGQQHLKKKTRSSAVVVGTVYCDTCFNSAFPRSPSHLIPGAVVAVECIDENSKPSFRQEVKTDEHGEFKAKLPFSVSKHVKKIKRCSVKLLSSSQPYCSIAASATSSSLRRLKSSKHGETTRVFSAGFFTFKPETQPEICSQKPINLRGTKPLLPDPSFPPPIQDPVPDNPLPILPNIPILPPLLDLPLLPTLPPLLPGSPQRSASLRNKKDISLDDKKTKVLKPDSVFTTNPVTSLLPPNPLNPPSIIPPNPVTPLLPPVPLVSSPPSLPPLLSQPPPSALVPPTPQHVPVITPPSPSAPSFSVSLPPIFIGIPPASSSSSSHHQP
ncbi:Proline-rich protein [Hirschfeldia incana]|nr:Proline-rich protein [Hirschfeldia incana]